MCMCVAGPRLEEDEELRVFGGSGGDVVKMVNDNIDQQRVSAHNGPTLFVDYLGVHNITS